MQEFSHTPPERVKRIKEPRGTALVDPAPPSLVRTRGPSWAIGGESANRLRLNRDSRNRHLEPPTFRALGPQRTRVRFPPPPPIAQSARPSEPTTGYSRSSWATATRARSRSTPSSTAARSARGWSGYERAGTNDAPGLLDAARGRGDDCGVDRPPRVLGWAARTAARFDLWAISLF